MASLLRDGKTRGPTIYISPNSTIDMDKQQKQYQPGRRPAKQGPRPLPMNQGRVGKLATGTRGKTVTSSQGQPKALQLRKKLRLGTWNVRSMLKLGKVQMLGREMERLAVDLCGLCEVRWEGQGRFTTDGHMIVYSGRTVQGMSGVAVWIHRKLTGAILGFEPISDRTISVRLNAKPRNVTLIQVYGPTNDANEEEVASFYEGLSRAVQQTPKGDMLLVLGDLNAKVGAKDPSELTAVVGPYGLGEMNEAGERLQDFCSEHELALANTMFQHHPRRLYTWTSPESKTRNQIDYRAVAQKWKASLISCKTCLGADCNTDHNLLVATVKVKVAKTDKQHRVPPLNLEALKDGKAAQFAAEVPNRFSVLEALKEEKMPDELWKSTKEVLLEAARETLGSTKAVKKKTWISDETFSLIKEKREAKGKDINRYRQLKADVQTKLRTDKQKQLDGMCE